MNAALSGRAISASSVALIAKALAPVPSDQIIDSLDPRRAPTSGPQLTRVHRSFFTDGDTFTRVVNDAQTVNIDGVLERDAVRILREIPGVAVEPRLPDGDRPDVVIQAGGVTVVIEVKAQRVANAAAAQQLIAYARHLTKDAHLVVVAQSVTEDARDQLTAAGIGFIDSTGAMRINLPGLYLWRDGQTRPARRTQPDAPGVKLSGKAGLATQALLRDPRRPWNVHDLADEARVSVGLVHRLFLRLEHEELVQAQGSGPKKKRRVTNGTALLDLWAEEMRDRGVHQRRAYRLARDPRALAGTLSKTLSDAKIDHAISGSAAAARLAPFVTAVPVTEVWVSELGDLDRVARAAGADEVSEGHNVVFRSARDDLPLAFRKRAQGVWLADPLRVYLDLRADPRRGREQATRLREEVIKL